MIVEELSPQAVVHDSGAIVASTGRDSFVYARGGRTISLSVEPLQVYYVRLPADPRWDDGAGLTQDEADQLIADLLATFEHWGEGCELIPPGDPRILTSLDQIVDHLRAGAAG